MKLIMNHIKYTYICIWLNGPLDSGTYMFKGWLYKVVKQYCFSCPQKRCAHPLLFHPDIDLHLYYVLSRQCVHSRILSWDAF